MGNPTTRKLMEYMAAGHAEPRVPSTYSGMLAWVTLDARMEAARQLPAARAGELERVRHVEVMDPHLGRVRIWLSWLATVNDLESSGHDQEGIGLALANNRASAIPRDSLTN